MSVAVRRIALSSIAATLVALSTLLPAVAARGGTSRSIHDRAAGTWSMDTTQMPPGATTFTLGGVSCPSDTSCFAVGYYPGSGNKNVALIEQWNGSVWTIQSPGIPSGATSSQLLSVSCESPSTCMAVGNYTYASGDTFQFGEEWSGASWTATPIAPLVGSLSSDLTSVSCPSATFCTAVGDGTSRKNTEVAVDEQWNGRNWTLRSVPLPGGATFVDMTGVACTSASACTAVGSVGTRNPSSGDEFTLAERWNGSKWARQATANPGGELYRELQSVTCSSTSSCVAVGNVTNAARTDETLSEQWSAGKWKTVATPRVAAVHYRNLFGVSCSSASSCVAVGYVQSTNSSYVDLAEGSNGATWQVQATPPVPGASYNELFSVSCTADGTCVAVGSNAAESN
jgi:hypothetical protein